MRFMFRVKGAHEGPPPPKFIEPMHQLADWAIKVGRTIHNGALTPPAIGAQVRTANRQLSVLDGPIAEAKEFMQLHKDLFSGRERSCELRTFASPAP